MSPKVLEQSKRTLEFSDLPCCLSPQCVVQSLPGRTPSAVAPGRRVPLASLGGHRPRQACLGVSTDSEGFESPVRQGWLVRCSAPSAKVDLKGHVCVCGQQRCGPFVFSTVCRIIYPVPPPNVSTWLSLVILSDCAHLSCPLLHSKPPPAPGTGIPISL